MIKMRQMLEAYSKQIEAGPTADLHLSRARTHALMGNTKEAQTDIEKALTLQPNHPDVHDHLALVHLKNGNYEAAAKAAEQAHKINPDSDYTHWMIAKEGQRLSKKIQKNPTAALYHKRGLLSLYQGVLLPAKQDFEAAIKLDSNLASAYANLAHTLLKLAQPDEAVKVLDEISDRTPDFKSDDIFIAKKWSFLEEKATHSPTAALYKELGKMCVEQETLEAWQKAQEYYDKAQDLDNQAIAKLLKLQQN